MGGGASKAASGPQNPPSLESGRSSRASIEYRIQDEAVPSSLQQQVDALARQVAELTARLSSLSLRFSVAQYNILAGYLGNNTEPWFMYGVSMPPERRAKIIAKHGEKGPDGKYVNVGWPNYVRGILSEEEIAKVEAVDRDAFSWEGRKGRLMNVVADLNADVISLVECDHYHDFFKGELEKLGYDMMWAKRPRPNSADGCCIAWKRSLFELDQPAVTVEYVDKYDPVRQKTYKDRIALLALLRFKGSSQRVLVVSTHLTRNPEDPSMDALRAKQIGQVLRQITEFSVKVGCLDDAPVVLAGDLNATSFQKLRGIANAVMLLTGTLGEGGASGGTQMHPFTLDCKELPTGKTSVTAARDVRIDALLYQSQKLALVDSRKAPTLTTPIPDMVHPSDHIPIMATFEVRSSLDYHQDCARAWYNCVGGRIGSVPLTREQLQSAWFVFELDGNDLLSRGEFLAAVAGQLGYATLDEASVMAVYDKAVAPGAEGITFEGFKQAYMHALTSTGLPGIDDLRDAFVAFDKDGSGSLDASEVASIFKHCSPVALEEGGDETIFRAIDRNGDGSVTADEFLAELTASWLKLSVE